MQLAKKEMVKNSFSLITYSILPLLFWIMVSFAFDTPYLAVLTILTALIHECGHLFAIVIFAKKSSLPLSNTRGFKIKLKENISYKEHIFILIAGPLINLILFFILLPFFARTQYICDFGIINLLTAISNLLPIETYDGYSIVKQILYSKNMSEKIVFLDAFSFLISVVFTVFSLYLVLRTNSGYWLFIIFFANTLNKVKSLCQC